VGFPSKDTENYTIKCSFLHVPGSSLAQSQKNYTSQPELNNNWTKVSYKTGRSTQEKSLIVGFCILLRVYPLKPFLKPPYATNVFRARLYCALLTTCFGPDRWPSSGKMYTKYILTDPLTYTVVALIYILCTFT
jgi:hypothetical protein